MTNIGALMKSLEVQIDQLALTTNLTQKGKFLSDTKTNPKEQYMIITLQSRRVLEEPEPTNVKEMQVIVEKEVHMERS